MPAAEEGGEVGERTGTSTVDSSSPHRLPSSRRTTCEACLRQGGRHACSSESKSRQQPRCACSCRQRYMQPVEPSASMGPHMGVHRSSAPWAGGRAPAACTPSSDRQCPAQDATQMCCAGQHVHGSGTIQAAKTHAQRIRRQAPCSSRPITCPVHRSAEAQRQGSSTRAAAFPPGGTPLGHVAHGGVHAAAAPQ